MTAQPEPIEPIEPDWQSELTDYWMDTWATCKYLGVTRDWCYAHLNQIPHVKVDRLLRFKKSELDAWMESKRR